MSKFNGDVHRRVSDGFEKIYDNGIERDQLTTDEIVMILAMAKAGGLDVLTSGERQIIDGLIEIIERRAAVESTKDE